MSQTCPTCLHVVEMDSGSSGKCANCGALQTPTPNGAWPTPGAPSAPAPNAQVPPPPPGTPEHTRARTRSASVVALVFGLLFVIPIFPQVIAISVGLAAILRRRLPEERIAVAWVGLIMGLAALVGWVYLGIAVLVPAIGAIGVGFVSTIPVVNDASCWEHAASMEKQMDRVHVAIRAHNRDFRRWPVALDEMIGKSLPRRFKLAKELTFRPIPATDSGDFDWIVVISTPLDCDTEGDPLDPPRRMVLRLSGKTEFISVEEEAALLQESPGAEESAPPETSEPLGE